MSLKNRLEKIETRVCKPKWGGLFFTREDGTLTNTIDTFPSFLDVFNQGGDLFWFMDEEFGMMQDQGFTMARGKDEPNEEMAARAVVLHAESQKRLHAFLANDKGYQEFKRNQ